MAIRPKSLIVAISPVMIGTSMAYGDGINHWLSAFLTLLAAIFIQIGTNLTNDYFDYRKGTDQVDRDGPVRMISSGLVQPQAVKLAFIGAFFLSILIGIFLVIRGGWPILAIGILSILAGYFYTAGARPLGYIGLGEILVLIFFGPVAVAGTYYVQSLEVNLAVVLAGLGPGFLSVAILVVNNLRDINSDKKVGKRTLAVRFGRSFAMQEYLFCILMASFAPILIYCITQDKITSLLSVLIAFIAIPAIKTVFTQSEGLSLNRALGYTGYILIIYSALFSVGWIV